MLLVSKQTAKELLNIKSDSTLRKLRIDGLIKSKKIGSHYKYLYTSIIDFANSSNNENKVKIKRNTTLANMQPVKLNHWWS
jgi:hypothetical protein